jgi:hypothetical protein
MPDDTPEQSPHAPRSVSLTDEDRRLLAALLDELIGKTKDGRPPPGAEDASHNGGGVCTTNLASA